MITSLEKTRIYKKTQPLDLVWVLDQNTLLPNNLWYASSIPGHFQCSRFPEQEHSVQDSHPMSTDYLHVANTSLLSTHLSPLTLAHPIHFW